MTYFPLRQTTCFFIPLVAPCKPLLIKNFSELLGGFDLRFNYQLTGEIDQVNRVAYFSLKTVKQLERRRLHDRESI